MGTDTPYYVPWMQATYIMAVNNKAMEYLPDGADVNALTYEQMGQWAQTMQEETGQARVGFPARPRRADPPVPTGLSDPRVHRWAGHDVR